MKQMTNRLFRPDTTVSILSQLNAEFLTIPDTWEARSLPVGHKIGTAGYLFSQIKQQEWREQFGGEEARKAKDETAKKAAAKKAEKERRKAKKAAGAGVEASEKGQNGPASKTAEEEVARGVEQVSLQTS
jgi:methionyl-tRNA synthetase